MENPYKNRDINPAGFSNTAELRETGRNDLNLGFGTESGFKIAW